MSLSCRPPRSAGHRAKGIATLAALILPLALLAADRPARAATAQANDTPHAARHYTEKGSQTCLYCHSSERMTLVQKTPHGDKDDPEAPFAKHGCESCHGPGSLHSTRTRRGRGRPQMVEFGDSEDVRTPVTEQNDSCLKCHGETVDKGPTAFEWEHSVHAKEDVACANCHQIHTTNPPMKSKDTQATVCYSCHEKTKEQHPTFEDVGIQLDKLSCWDCHAVHELIAADEGEQAATR